MENIADKLHNYRLRKRRRERFQRFKDSIRDFIMLGVHTGEQSPVTLNVAAEPLVIASHLVKAGDDDDTFSNNEDPLEGNIASASDSMLQYALWVVYFAFWVTSYIISIELQFGIVFLILSALVAIYLNTRTGPKKHNEISAYSVFNKNCESIDGTLKAEQFEREIGIR